MRPKLNKKYLFAGIITCFSVCFSFVHAQPAKPMFQVIHLPRKAGYSKEKLNTELAPLKDKEAVKKLLRSKNFPSQTTIVIYINRPNSQTAYWNINTSSPTDKEDNRIILQSRDNASLKVFKLTEFKTIFKDTVAVIDTLRLELFIKDDDYPDGQYFLETACNDSLWEEDIPFKKGQLVITKSLVKECKKLPLLSLHNKGNQYRVLANSFSLHFLTEEEKNELLSVAAFIQSETPNKETKDIAIDVYGYAANHYGNIPFPQLITWLQKNTAALNGNH